MLKLSAGKRKILFLLPNLNSGGAEKVAMNYLRSLDARKFQATLLVFNKTDQLLELVPEEVDVIDMKTKKTSHSAWGVLMYLWRVKPDFVYTTHSRVASLLMAIRPFSSRFKHIARMQSTPSLELKYSEYGMFKKKLYSWGFNCADVVLAQTEDMKKDAVEVFKIPDANIAVLHNPLDLLHIKCSLAELPSPYSQSNINIVAAGRLSKEKGYRLIIEAIPTLLKEYPNIVVHILGKDQGEKKELLELAEELNVVKMIKFHGFVANPYPFYAFSDLFVLSSYWEGYPNVLLENFYLNTPIVATRCIPSLQELIDVGVNGYLCEVGNAVDLADKILLGITLKRDNIHNPSLPVEKLESILERWIN